MRRTYKSKKDTGGGLDHRDMLFNMDEKSSAFDAFYIQNIKQTKREQSCMGSSNNYGAASNKVRKRKYVKRLIKDVEPPPVESQRESISGSLFLTPDKSLRVNKAPDLFDQLLNSSPACSDVKQVKKVDLFDQVLAGTPKETRTYNRKKKIIKKFNYSSSTESSVSDKENTSNNHGLSIQNTTDIKSHELIVEKEAKPTPQFDESINNIVKKLSLINNINGRGSGSLKKTFKYKNNRLTKNYHSPATKTSPLSSTPYTQRNGGKSIYKFSPIPMGDLDDSPNYVTIADDDDNEINKSVVFVPKNISNALKRSQDKNSPIPSLEYGSKCKGNSDPLFSSDANSHENLKKDDDSSGKVSINNAEDVNPNSIQLSSLQISEVEPFFGFSEETIAKVNKSLIPENEGKDDSIIISTAKVSKCSQKSKALSTESNETKSGSFGKENKNLSVIEYSIPPEPFFGFTKQSDSIINISATDDSLPSKPFLGFTEIESHIETVDDAGHLSQHSELDEGQNESIVSKNESVVNDTIEQVPEHSETETNSVGDEVDTTKLPKTTAKSSITLDSDDDDEDQVSQMENITKEFNSSLSSFSSKSEDINSCNNKTSEGHSDYDEKESLYDTCNSDVSISEEDSKKEPIVALEKMDIALFEKYYKKMPVHYSKKPVVALERLNIDLFKKYHKDNPKNIDGEGNNSEGELSEGVSESYASLEDSDYNVDEDIEQNSQSTNAENDITTESDLDCSSQGTTSSENRQSIGDRCVSFVTTRRRNEPANDSNVFVLDDSQDSSSIECDKTVLSNKKDSLINPVETNVDTEQTTTEVPDEANDTNKLDSRSPEPRLSYVTTRKSSLCRRSAHPKIDTSTTTDIKPAIILQPGKKWERSLSIYRRMTMNDHFEHSILEDEDLRAKGRKYRQSVIETMEMQDRTFVTSIQSFCVMSGLLHNESIQTRRSTFVSKPSRSTIRIVKDTNSSRLSLSNTAVFDDLKELGSASLFVRKVSKAKCMHLSLQYTGFLEDCDDTIVELSKLSIADDHDVTVIEKLHEASRIATARDYVLRRCNQSDTVPFDECYPDHLLKNCRKIGEGVYGEVFLWRAPDGRARVMKVVPIAGHVTVNGERQKDFGEIIAEIVIAMELSALRAPIAEIECLLNEGKDVDALDLHSVENATDVFNEVLAVKCVYGGYPSRLLDLWELYDETKGSENDNPAILPVDQQYIVLELANAGQDLESYQFNSADQAHALFLQSRLLVLWELYDETKGSENDNPAILPVDQQYIVLELANAGQDLESYQFNSADEAHALFLQSRLLVLWELYDETKGSENDNPAILPVDQQYIVLELANAGQDLESYQFNSADQAHALFLQVRLISPVCSICGAVRRDQGPENDNPAILPVDQQYIVLELANAGQDLESYQFNSADQAHALFLQVRLIEVSQSRLLDLWELYDETKGSENDNPAILPVDQQYIVLELANAGQDLESYQFNSADQAHALFLQVRLIEVSQSRLLDLWELYDETKGSENDNPAILPVDQQYIVLELANAGQDLESYQFNSADQAHALFLQVAFGLAVGEESFQFEHRDLHWGNVLIAPTEQKYATFVLRGRAHRVARRGVAATIIDYSLSRVSLPLARRQAEPSETDEQAALYNDLAADEGLFGAVGDYQFEVYRLMRDKLGNEWKKFEPYTNILWLHYTVDKMITALRYKTTNTKLHKQYINKLKGIKERVLGYGSAAQFVLTDNEF
ncbi:haspin like kinase domain-containing protein [Phthorimaea operculella]|nr:haspin like kinase domain-containing protein [Phthorimaea operculella]